MRTVWRSYIHKTIYTAYRTNILITIGDSNGGAMAHLLKLRAQKSWEKVAVQTGIVGFSFFHVFSINFKP